MENAEVKIAWVAFVGDGISEDVIAETPIGDELKLADGACLKGQPLEFPASGRLRLDQVVSPVPGVLVRTLLVGNCYVEEPMEIVLGVSIDWKWAIYLNGQMLCDARYFGNGDVSFTPNEHKVRCKLRQGANQIVAEIFCGNLYWTAIKQVNPVMPGLKRPPLVHFPDAYTGGMTVTFTLDQPSPAGITYRKAGTGEWRRVYDSRGGIIRRDACIHHIRLSGLEADCDYEYQVFILDESNNLTPLALGKTEHFHTLPGAGKGFAFMVSADAQEDGPRLRWMQQVFQRDYAQNIAFFGYIGDVFWTSDFERDVMEKLIAPYQTYSGNRLPLEFVRGNHEYYGMDAISFFKYFSVPEPGRDGYGMFRCGDVCFIVLDFGDDTPACPFPSTRAYFDNDSYLGEQRAWLERMIEEPICKNAKYRIVLAHAVPYGDELTYMPQKVADGIRGLFDGENPRCRIHLWLCGHVHYALRTRPNENDFYSAVPINKKYPDWRKKRKEWVNHYGFTIATVSGPGGFNPPELQLSDMVIAVSDSGLTVHSHDINGREFDSFTVDEAGQVTDGPRADFFQLNQVDKL